MSARSSANRVLTGPLAWLGAVELGYGKEQQTGENTVPQSFRLTEVGAWLLGLADMPEFAEVHVPPPMPKHAH